MYFDKKFRSNRLEFQPSFIVKLLFITVLQSVERVLGNKVIFSNLVIYSLSILTSCQFTNEPNCEISRGVFQNRRVCGQAFPLLPSPPTPSIFLLPLQLSRSNSTGNACYAGCKNSFELPISHFSPLLCRLHEQANSPFPSSNKQEPPLRHPAVR